MQALELFQRTKSRRAYSNHHPVFDGQAAAVEINNGNKLTTITGSIFDLQWVVHPNPPHIAALEVLESFAGYGVRYNSISMALKMRNADPNPVRIELTVYRAGERVGQKVVTVQGTARTFAKLSAADGGTLDQVGLVVKAANTNAISRTGVCVTSCLLFDDDELTELANAAKSDKGTVHAVTASPHCYSMAYDALFRDRKLDALNILEIGLNVGAHERERIDGVPSLRMWRQYFPHANIFGIDIVDPSKVELPHNVKVACGDQGDSASVEAAMAEFGDPPLDIVIDDGSHAPSHQRITFETLFTRLRRGGIYVIEDLHWQPWPERPTIAQLLDGADEHTFDGRFSNFFRLVNSADCTWQLFQPNDARIAVFAKL